LPTSQRRLRRRRLVGPTKPAKETLSAFTSEPQPFDD
jgi:hypothetical protein